MERLESLLLGGPASVAIVRTHDESSTQLDRVLREALTLSAKDHGLSGHQFLAVEHHDHLCMILPKASAEMFLRSLVSHAQKKGREVHCALGGDVAGGSDYAAAHAMALTAMAALQALGFPHRIYKANDLGSLGVILAEQREYPHAYSPVTEIGPLITYDAQHGTELTRTAWAYSEYRENVKATATRLKVHENTVRQRLARVAELIGSDWQGARFLDIQLGLRIWSLSQPADRP